MGPRPAHFPETEFKALHDGAAIHLLFRVRDRYVVARKTRYQDPVCEDSCVEFFFYPGESSERGYFNLEVNCCGTFLFRFQRARGCDVKAVSEEHASRVGIGSSLDCRVIDPERSGPLTWMVHVRVPVEVIAAVVPGASLSGAWRVNLYKCADRSSHPHWLTWRPVRASGPDFHRPESFGRFVFQEP
jgi:hypothetical protein